MTTSDETDPRERLARFRERRQESLLRPRSSLALVTTQWLSEEDETVWPVPGRWSPRPAEHGILVRAAADDAIVVDGELVDGEALVRAGDAQQPGGIAFSETVSGTVISGRDGYALRVWDARSEAMLAFDHVDAFDYNPDWVIEATFTPVEGLTVGFEHVKDGNETRETPIPGEIRFTRDGVDYNLAAFREGRALQLVFGDATNGVTSYSVGRFLFVAPRPDGRILLDFNLAVLPPCAFSFAFNCPIPPPQNRFAVPIEAGEKNPVTADGTPLH